jgi:hypothetical protein
VRFDNDFNDHITGSEAWFLVRFTAENDGFVRRDSLGSKNKKQQLGNDVNQAEYIQV